LVGRILRRFRDAMYNNKYSILNTRERPSECVRGFLVAGLTSPATLFILLAFLPGSHGRAQA